MNTLKKLVLFDFDGVIVNTYDMCFDINKILDPDISHELYRSYFEGNIFESIGNKELKVSNDVVDFESEYERCLHGDHKPEDIMVDIARSLADRYTLFIVSSTPSQVIKKFLENHGLESSFKEILGADAHESKIVKIQSILDRYAVKGGDCVFITDTLGDIREAERVGVKSIAVTWGFHPKETLEKGNPFVIVSDPSELILAIENYFNPSTSLGE
jgi:phosphoglycolate phosphatase